jgi:hypothetical protein
VAIGVSDHDSEDNVALSQEQRARITFPEEFLKLFHPIVKVGSTIVVTDDPILPTTSAATMTIITNTQEEP